MSRSSLTKQSHSGRAVYSLCLSTILLLLAVLVLSCNKGYSASNNTPAHNAGGPVEYPEGWPLPDLTAPPGAVCDYLPSFYVAFKYPSERKTRLEKTLVMDVMGGGKIYMIAFEADRPFDDVVAHIEGILLPRGYALMHSDDSRGNEVYRWQSQDAQTSVQLSQFTDRENMLTREYRGFVLDVSN